MRKIITVIMLVIAITLCGACTSPQEFDDLKTQTAALEKLVDELQNKLNGNEQNAALMQEKIEELQKLNDLYKKQISNLSGVPIEFTATNNKYIDRCYGIEEYITFDSEETSFQDFYDYYTENHPCDGKNVIIFRHNDDDDVKITKDYFKIVKSCGQYIVGEMIDFSDDIFGSYAVDKQGKEKNSLSLIFCWAPTTQVLDNIDNFYIEFGHYYEFVREDRSEEVKYFNIYYNRECIGTCYYNAYCYISHTSIQEYIKNRLMIVKGDEK